VKVRLVTMAEVEALRNTGHTVDVTVDTPTEIQALLRSSVALLDMPMHDISWALRIRLTDTLRQLRTDYPGVVTPTRVESVPTPVHYTNTASPVHHVHSRVGGTFRSDKFRELAQLAIADGWVATETGTGHVRLTKDTRTLILSKTSTGKGRAWQNLKAQAKRAGIDTTTL
jgi:hypothetical protein